MIYRIARLCQLAGLILLPVSIAGEALGRHDLRFMLSLASLGLLLFIIGWALQQFVKPK